ncbi:MAG: hypothetical protein DME76_12620 [Verrucomicrobia bacterium]|nr:MAG: hypothetical protein DME76_12620 [Verrucomicrobiota bacterium]
MLLLVLDVRRMTKDEMTNDERMTNDEGNLKRQNVGCLCRTPWQIVGRPPRPTPWRFTETPYNYWCPLVETCPPWRIRG